MRRQLEWSSQDSVDSAAPWFLRRFKFLGTHSADATVAPRSIVERIDVVGHVGPARARFL